MLADQAFFRHRAGQNHGSGGPVVGSHAGILGQSATEFAENQDADPIRLTRLSHVCLKCGNAPGHLIQKPCVNVQLIGVGVKPVQACVENTRIKA